MNNFLRVDFMKKNVVVGIPVRMGSSRFPGKPLIQIAGKSMVSRVYENVSDLGSNIFTFVATCDEEVNLHLADLKIPFIKTDININRPGQRIAAACRRLELSEDDLVIVVQGDEPLVTSEMVQQVINELRVIKDDNTVVNLCAPANWHQLNDPNEVKVVLDKNFFALYFSRSPIPSNYHVENPTNSWRQVCVFGFHWKLMKIFYEALEPTPLEMHESIELNRALESGIKVKMVPINQLTKSVDTPNDIIEVELILKGK
jgi:3-deoxy-manno-octulosonate cytidylyltransferase (CMP-KDO synthetase)